MRAEVQYDGTTRRAPRAWTVRVRQAVQQALHPTTLAAYGISAELLAFCGVALQELLWDANKGQRRYALEHLIEALALTFDDLVLLGLRLTDLAQPHHYPLVVLYRLCHVRADALFRFDVGFDDVQRALLDVDPRYAQLLQLNLPFWRRALTLTPVA